jgi:hypothetical protein
MTATDARFLSGAQMLSSLDILARAYASWRGPTISVGLLLAAFGHRDACEGMAGKEPPNGR